MDELVHVASKVRKRGAATTGNHMNTFMENTYVLYLTAVTSFQNPD
jgi:hypothetical protein